MTEPAGSRRAARQRPEPIELPGIVPVTPVRMSDDLADQIRRLILSEDVSEGARLPSERDLAERFGASRPTISQALRKLALMGLVEIRRGSGAYVLRRPEAMVTASVNLMLDHSEHSATDLLQLRLWLETLGVEHAATREPPLTEQEVTGILAALNRLGATTGDFSKWIAEDTVFHATVVRGADNPFLAAVYESVHTAVLSHEYKYWVEADADPAWLSGITAADLVALHEPIARAVIDHDPAAARAAVLRHHEVMAEHMALALESARRAPGRAREARP